MTSWRTWIVRTLLAVYKASLSPLFAGSCRYTPSCSVYMAEAIELHGWLHGSWLGLKRLARCNRFGSFGADPVPMPEAANSHLPGRS